MRFNHLPSTTLLLGICLLSACGQNKGAQPAAGEPEVTVVTITPQTITLTTELPGRTSAHVISEVRPQVGGIIQKRLFVEGREVKAGEVLYQIDPATYQAAYDSAKATLAQAEANALPAKLKAERYANLVKVNGVSKQDNDDAQAANMQSQAAVLAAKAALETARINLSYTRVTSPISGRIGKSSVTPGALVTASQATALATVQQTDPIYVDVTQSSAEVMRLKRELDSGRLKKSADGGARVRLFMEDGTPYPQEGTLQFADITVDQTTGAVNVRVVFPNHGHDLLPGLYVRAVLSEGTDAAALLVPQPAVSRDTKGNASVMVVKADGTVEARPLELSRVLGDKWLVNSGLAAGERVIVDGLQKVRPGAKVKAVEAAAPTADGQANATQVNATQANAAQPAAAQGNAAKPAPEPKAAPAAKKAEPAKAAVKAEKPAEPKAPAKAKTEAPAKAKAEAPAKAKAEAPAKAKTQPEAPAKAKAQPEAPAKAQPEASDKAKAEAAAKAKKEERKAYSPPEGERPVSTLDSRPAGQ